MEFRSFDWLFSPPADRTAVADSASAPDPVPAAGGRSQSGAKRVFTADSNRQMTVGEVIDLGQPPMLNGQLPDDRGYRIVWQSDDKYSIELDAAPSSLTWNFVTSRYIICLLLIGVFVNRIQHICRPRGRAARLQGWKRWLLRLPAISMLAYATFKQGIRILQVWAQPRRGVSKLADLVLAYDPPLSSQQEQYQADARTLWISFLACSVSVATESLNRTIEGIPESSPPSNLVGLAFTLQSYQLDPKQAGLHFFLLIFLQTTEAFAMSLVGSLENPTLRRLHVTTFFGLAGILHYLYLPSSQSPLFFGFDRMPDIGMLAVITSTVFLHGLTMLLTEGKIQADRLLFSSSNLPSLEDDFSLALFKLGTACLQSTRLNGLSRELVSIEVPEKTYVEVDDSGAFKMRIGLDAVLKTGTSASGSIIGLDNEVRLTVPSARSEAQYESAILMSSTKWREIKRFLSTVAGVFDTLYRVMYERFPRVRHRLPHWVSRLPRWLRLFWHGQNGEREREERLARQCLQKQQTKSLKEEAVKSVLTRHGVALRDGEKLEDAVWRLLREAAVTRAGGEEASGEEKAELFGLDVRLWQYLETHSKKVQLSQTSGTIPGNEAGAVTDDADEDDADWQVDEEDEDADSAASSVVSDDNDEDGLFRRARLPSRSIFSPSPIPEDSQDADEAAMLLQLARIDFESDRHATNTGTSASLSEVSAFNRVLLAHIASGDGAPPLTRSQYRSLVASPGNAVLGRGSPIGSEQRDTQANRLCSTILRRRKGRPASSVAPSDEDRRAERERLRLCVVCCYEERTILCWPCRCLALCDGCREELASRPSGGSVIGGGAAGARPGDDIGPAGGRGGRGLQNCPTCRSKVQGFSRVYLP